MDNILQRLAEHANYVVFAYSLANRQFVYLNPFFEEVWQQTRDRVMSDPAMLLETVHLEDRAYVSHTFQTLANGANGATEKEIEFQIQLPDQSKRWICLSVFSFEEDRQTMLGGFARDMTEQRNHSDTLQRFAAKKNSVLEILSHDLARPLANIQGLSAMLAKHTMSYGNEKVNDLISKITATSERGIHLIRDFVKQEFLESAQVGLIKKRVNLVAKLTEVMEQYQESEKDIQKTFHFYTNSEMVDIDIDEVKFMQVINNLLSNAIKFTQDKGVITVRLEEQEDHVLLTVEDDGIGIPAVLQEGLFEKFPKARRPGVKGEPSTGLGMSIIKTIVEWHGGQIWFESEENKGTIFHMSIPKE